MLTKGNLSSFRFPAVLLKSVINVYCKGIHLCESTHRHKSSTQLGKCLGVVTGSNGKAIEFRETLPGCLPMSFSHPYHDE